MKELLIVGAGITGSLTAALLSRLPSMVASQGTAITVWDKARGAGGRMSTHRHQGLQVDMGAQYVSHFKTQGTVEYEQLKGALYEELLSNRVLVPFKEKIEGERSDPLKPILQNYVAPDGLSAIAKHFLKSSIAKTSFQHQLAQINLKTGGDDQKGRSAVQCKTSSGLEADFDAVVLTMPVPQILTLGGNLLKSPAAGLNLSDVRFSSRYALGLFYEESTVAAAASPGIFDLGWSAKYFDNPIIRFASWDLSKRGADTNNGRTLLIHTSVPFAIDHLETDKEEVKETLMKKLAELIPGLPKPDHSHIIRWRYSQVSQAYSGSPGYVVLSHDPLVVATGDGFTGSNFENCIRAAQATSELLESRLAL